MASTTRFSLITYLKNARAEFKKVTWPTRKEAINSTIIVIIFSVVIASFLGAVDYVLNLGLTYLIDHIQ